jgi:hypothetical protein
MPFMLSRICISRIILTLAFTLMPAVVTVSAQSTDVRFPTPVDNTEIVGAIPARDIGDARLSDHFYTFSGLPGDLLITVESKNLNGDFDVFTAGELRPVLKLVVYAESSSPVTKNIYLRKPENLILRVEGRTPNDDEGTYRIRFSGTFAPVERSLTSEAQPVEEANSRTSRLGERKTTRVTSAGARIYEPPAEVAALPVPEPTPVPNVEDTSTPAKSTVAKAPRVRRPTPRRAPSKASSNSKTEKTPVTIDGRTEQPTNRDDEKARSNEATAETANAAGPATTRRTPAPRPKRGNTRPSKSAATVENGQLIIEVKDGLPLKYSMSTVSKVTIENGEVVIVISDGNVMRVPLTSVLRMSIGP